MPTHNTYSRKEEGSFNRKQVGVVVNLEIDTHLITDRVNYDTMPIKVYLRG